MAAVGGVATRAGLRVARPRRMGSIGVDMTAALPKRVFGPPSASSASSLTGCFARALVVEDHDATRGMVVEALRRWGAAAVGAANVAQARALLSSPPKLDLVLVDVRLPDGSGATIAREASGRRPRPLVVGMSAVATPREAFDLSQAGVRAFLTKPFSLEQLAATLHGALLEHEIAELRAGRRRAVSRPTRAALANALQAFSEAYDLTPGQHKLIAALAEGTPRNRLASALGVSENTLKKRLRVFFSRCHVKSSADLAALVWDQALRRRA